MSEICNVVILKLCITIMKVNINNISVSQLYSKNVWEKCLNCLNMTDFFSNFEGSAKKAADTTLTYHHLISWYWKLMSKELPIYNPADTKQHEDLFGFVFLAMLVQHSLCFRSVCGLRQLLREICLLNAPIYSPANWARLLFDAGLVAYSGL